MSKTPKFISHECYFYNPVDKKFYCSITHTVNNQEKDIIINEQLEIVARNKNIFLAYPEFVAIGIWNYKKIIPLTITKKTVSALFKNHFKNNFKHSRFLYRDEKSKLENSQYRTFPYRDQDLHEKVSIIKLQVDENNGVKKWPKTLGGELQDVSRSFLRNEDIQEYLEAYGYRVTENGNELVMKNPSVVKKEEIKSKMKQEFGG